jgi:hypothetical protein
MRIYLYGAQAPAIAARDEPRWQAWMAHAFPYPAAAEATTQEAS